ncbi:MAG: selenite/tellurite reduction operon c-type cytochrome ExtM [Thermodesulfobacteriota bacterium]|nr:selenite/tellurite reduction operon c-type cytochrome ExtM [Thermodesulfobacteriota bacterium]
MIRLRGIVIVLCLVAFFAGGCGDMGKVDSTCDSCHKGLEQASAAHTSCVACHGGNPKEEDKEASHRSMFGPKNPADPRFWDQTCGSCHPYQLARVKGNLMYTNSGMIRNIQATWEGANGESYGARAGAVFDAAGNPLVTKSVAELDNMAGELYRKFCSLCHVGIESNRSYSASHGSGCAACHFPYNNTATYEGNDSTVKGKRPYSADHRLAPLPDNRVCFRCHNRSGRIALSYQGLNDGNNAMVPTCEGRPGPMLISGSRNVVRMNADIHYVRGMDCIDCHTSRDVMGDGYAYENMHDQTEISCEDCHGSATERPKAEAITRENDDAVRASKSYQRQMRPGMKMVLTAKGRKYANVFYENEKLCVLGKRSGKVYESKVITGTLEHTIRGHERMECYACHSRTVVQCYGCHTRYDQSRSGRDFVKGLKTPGVFSETEDYRRLYPFPLAVNQRGKISPVTPGCQTYVTVVEERGRTVKREYVSEYKGKKQLRFAPFYSHNTGSKAVGCAECHGNPSFLGFGEHVVEGNSITATLLSEKYKDKPLDGFVTMKNGNVKAFSAITRKNSRALNGEEVKNVLAVNLCIVCHDNGKDKIYQKGLDYRVLDDCLNRLLPASR